MATAMPPPTNNKTSKSDANTIARGRRFDFCCAGAGGMRPLSLTGSDSAICTGVCMAALPSATLAAPFWGVESIILAVGIASSGSEFRAWAAGASEDGDRNGSDSSRVMTAWSVVLLAVLSVSGPGGDETAT